MSTISNLDWYQKEKFPYPALITATAFQILVALGCHDGFLFFLFFFFLLCFTDDERQHDRSRPRIRDDWNNLIKQKRAFLEKNKSKIFPLEKEKEGEAGPSSSFFCKTRKSRETFVQPFSGQRSRD